MRKTTWALMFLVLAAPGGAFADEDDDSAQPGKVDLSDLGGLNTGLPTLDFGTGGVPDVGGLETGKKTDESLAAKGHTKVTYTAVNARHASRFSHNAKSGCLASRPFKAFRVPHVPAVLEPFQTCVRVGASEGVIATIVARVKNPKGKVVAEATGEISFARGSKTVDYRISWEGFPVRMPGDHMLEIIIAGQTVATFPIPVETGDG